jgi:hypothetical protein
MKTNKSSAECAARNLLVKSEIDLGLSEAWEPSDEILKRESAEAARAAAGFKFAADKLSVLKMLDPNTDGNKVLGISVKIEAIMTGGSMWRSGYQVGWKLIIGDSWKTSENRWLKIGDEKTLGLNARQLAKAQEKLASAVAERRAKLEKEAAATSDKMRTDSFIKENPAFCSVAGLNYFCDGKGYEANMGRQMRYPTAFIALVDGSVRIGCETFTVSQWNEIYALRAAQAATMKELKDSFKPVAA